MKLGDIHNLYGMREKCGRVFGYAGDFGDAGGLREPEPECGSLPQNAGDLATMKVVELSGA